MAKHLAADNGWSQETFVNFDSKKRIGWHSISEGIICKKAQCIYADLLKQIPSTSAEGESGFTYKASKGWSQKNLTLRWNGEAASSHKEAAKKYVGKFCDFINAGGYLSQQVLNCG